MTRLIVDEEDWEAANGRFLAASLEWLRLLLRRHVTDHTSPSDEPQPGRWPRRHMEKAPADASTPIRLRPDDVIDQAAQVVRDAEEISPPPALADLAVGLGLSRFERDTLLLCAAIELDPSIAQLCALAHGNERMPYPTFGLALSVLPDAAWEVVSPQRGLRLWRLIEITQHSGQGLIGSALRAGERVVNHIKGLNHIDDRLTPLLTRLDPAPDMPLPPSQQSVVDEVVLHWQSASAGAVVQLCGPDDAGKQLLAAHAAADRGMIIYRLPAALFPTQPAELDDLACLWQRESMLLPLALYLDAEDGAGEAKPPVARFVSRLCGCTILATRESWPDLGGQPLALDVQPPTPAERATAWRTALGPDADIDALAAQFGLDLPAIHEVASIANGDPATAWRACRIRTRPQLDALAQRLEPKVDWADIVLPPDAQQLLEQIADQVAQRTKVYETWGFGERISRGLGISVLFAGPSGVGKTMAAEVLANHLKLDLYRIDLSAVVSKYIGETEKNLRRLFDAADSSGSILFFDEADSLFGKRSEVKDAHDRYANIEVNYLLQRMEAYRGLAILATNMRTALDNAFLRRLRFIVEFPFPEAAQRRTIWEKAFPVNAPRHELDCERLARLQLSGGMTRNIALNAAFLAASADTPITMRHVLDAARAEFQKFELPIRELDFALDGEKS